MHIGWEANEIRVSGHVSPELLAVFCQGLFMLATKRGYELIVLDFSDVESIFESFMAPAVVQCARYRQDGIEFELKLPNREKIRNLFHNSNWAHLIAPNENAASTFSGYQHLPAETYRTSSEQYAVVDRVMNVIIGNLNVERRQLKALEWCVNEITDNVLNHSESEVGGIVQASTFPARNSVEFVVADAGVGIRRTLGGRNDGEALSRAIQEGVTRNSKTNQGNGLYGSYRVAAISGGQFHLTSGRATLACKGIDDVKIFERNGGAMFVGTVVTSQIQCDNEKLIEQALTFNGKIHEPPFDFIDSAFDAQNSRELTIVMSQEAGGFGTRDSGRIVRTKIANLLRADAGHSVRLDFGDVGIISSSFADEAVGKIFLELGPIQFMSRVKIANADSTIKSLIDRAILQRSRQMTLDDIDG